MIVANDKIRTFGKPLAYARKVLVMLHGREDDVLSFSKHIAGLNIDLYTFAVVLPQATGNIWYPNNLLSTRDSNEPQLSNSILKIDMLIKGLYELGFRSDDIYLFGFAQGGSLALEFTARSARRYGGLIVLAGGLMGEKISTELYSGNFQRTPIFIGSGNNDPFAPLQRIEDTVRILTKLGASVYHVIYYGIGHTIIEEELRQATFIIND